MILAIDTTSERGSLALWQDGTLLCAEALNSPDGFGHVLFGAISALPGFSLDRITAFAAASGPGSFTGIRVGLAAIKGLAEATGRPAFGISTLAAIAAFSSAPLRAPLFNAHRGEVYGGLYDASLAPLSIETVGPLDEWLARLPSGAEIVSPDIDLFASALAGRSSLACPHELAPSVARLAEALLRSGHTGDPAALDANYVRRSDAEIFFKG